VIAIAHPCAGDGAHTQPALTTILSSIGLSLAITALMSLLLHGRVRGDFMTTGLVCAIVVGLILDRVTRQHREALRRLNADLERRVRERTAELADLQRQLMLRDRMATAGTMAAAIGHEIRSPLTVITLGAGSLAEVDGVERETIADICRTILESSGGGMEITSAPDRGTTVRITLRVAAKPATG
jgi:signal transduction histidine kinase